MRSTRHAALVCPTCSAVLDTSTCAEGDAIPTTNDVTLCGNCGELLGYEQISSGAIRPRVLSAEELASLSADDHARIAAVRALIAASR